ncbi:MAG: hypothetical protein DRR16_15600 [Candidatus Parabeggiatoa sp. nov. 3]|nr:MAG: hypothetical protein DRR00_24305 [Gammaproteobacteria bacterium]RKZ61087.1 MAG: hypothetical protein DRQ99_20990 [Gammaproteobacteria bacterium]RKZ84111.1 MAG: hypothetical protein DRR16_15600 [Gammaproteobacteria bacterium]
MSYGKFETIEQVSDTFDIEITRSAFINQEKIEVDDIVLTMMGRRLLEDANFVNEQARCQHIITPILDIVSDNHESLKVWCQVTYTVDKDRGLDGEPDYMIAPYAKNGGMSTPPLCIMEAKQDDWKKGWAQALAEMYAASTQGASICYGVVTTGDFWQFSRLEAGKIFTRDPIKLSAIENLQKVLNTLNWLFKKASEQVQALNKLKT